MAKEMFGVQNSNLIPARLRTDPVRAEERRRVRVRLRDGHPGVAAARYRFFREDADDQGFIESVVYVGEMQQLQAKVEDDPAAIASATRNYFRKLREHVADSLPEQREKIAALADDLSQWPEWARKIERRCNLSIEREFHSMNGRGIRPFVELRVIEKLPAPQSPEQEHESRLAARRTEELGELAKVVAAAAAQAVTAALAPLLAQLIPQAAPKK